jgi:predicted GIY-YIG superfamily endonuclease
MSFQIHRATTTINLAVPKPTHYIYRFHCLSTDLMYIGMTTDPERRIQEHLDGNGSKPLLKALVDYGINDFNLSILDSIHSGDESEALALENTWIKKYNSLHPLGFNLRLNGPIIPNLDPIPETIKISGKYVFSFDNSNFFSVGELTQARNFQMLLNVLTTLGPKGMAIKHLNGFRYIEIRLISGNAYVRDTMYDLKLQINKQNRLVLLA